MSVCAGGGKPASVGFVAYRFFNSPCLKVHQSFTKDSSTRTVSVHKSALNRAGISHHVKSILWISSWFTRACILLIHLSPSFIFSSINFKPENLRTDGNVSPCEVLSLLHLWSVTVRQEIQHLHLGSAVSMWALRWFGCKSWSQYVISYRCGWEGSSWSPE